MRVVIKNNYDNVCSFVADYIVTRIKEFKPTASKPFVLGLPTGSTPIGIYQNLIKKYQADELSFKDVVTFNMDEYVGLTPDHPQSYHYFMQQHLFNQVDIKKENINILNGLAKDLDAECISYEEKIKSYGGINLFLGGIGVDGHIAFNEPATSPLSRTAHRQLALSTIEANARFFDNDLSKVPTSALTVGVATIMDADEVVIVATGVNKSRAVHHVVERGVNHLWVASTLQLHSYGMLVCDDAATNDLKVGTVKYFKRQEDLRKNQELKRY
ncbi:MAG: glucosamine-6-phosphate deaminase [Candidatus Nanosyncoccaceae bacterium]|jgi:glucosamine-6-phosphate deaminase